MKKVIAATLLTVTIALSACGCASWNRAFVDIKSNVSGGLDRTINIYTYDGQLIAAYTGKIDIADSSNGYVKFDFNGKRYIYYNCLVETIAEI